jgi:hypothetical protein
MTREIILEKSEDNFQVSGDSHLNRISFSWLVPCTRLEGATFYLNLFISSIDSEGKIRSQRLKSRQWQEDW